MYSPNLDHSIHLMMACAGDHIEVVSYLLRGAVLNNMVEEGQAALDATIKQ